MDDWRIMNVMVPNNHDDNNNSNNNDSNNNNDNNNNSIRISNKIGNPQDS